MLIKKIALDAMGGDHGPGVVVAAALQVLAECPDLHLILVGQEKVLAPMLAKVSKNILERLSMHNASEVVGMDESPSSAMRSKKDSSMRVALNLVKSGDALACVSAGNTGALMATARFVLKTLPGIDRPAIMAALPTRSGKEVRLLDLGANVDSSPENLYQFAIMASTLTQALNGIEAPRVGLLNIGVEEIKGNELVKKASELFINSKSLNYVGYIEADKIFSDVADVVVCDGFAGNVALKSLEGAIKFMGSLAREEFCKSIFTKLRIAPAKSILKKIVNRMDPDRYNGATLLGLDGIVVKSHGGASVNAFYHAIKEAVIETEKNIPNLIKQRVESLLS